MLLQSLLKTLVCVLFRYSCGKKMFRFYLLNKIIERLYSMMNNASLQQ